MILVQIEYILLDSLNYYSFDSFKWNNTSDEHSFFPQFFHKVNLIHLKRDLLRPEFCYFSFYRPSRPYFLKIEKKNKRDLFNFIFVFPSDTCQYSTGVQLSFSALSFLLQPG